MGVDTSVSIWPEGQHSITNSPVTSRQSKEAQKQLLTLVHWNKILTPNKMYSMLQTAKTLPEKEKHDLKVARPKHLNIHIVASCYKSWSTDIIFVIFPRTYQSSSTSLLIFNNWLKSGFHFAFLSPGGKTATEFNCRLRIWQQTMREQEIVVEYCQNDVLPIIGKLDKGAWVKKT